MGNRKIVNGAYRCRYAPFFVYLTGEGYKPLALPLGELSPQVTERALHPCFPSPSSLRSATSPKERGKGGIINGQKCGSSAKIGAFRGNGKTVFVVRRDEGKADGADGVIRGAAVNVEDDGGAVDGIRVAAAE